MGKIQDVGEGVHSEPLVPADKTYAPVEGNDPDNGGEYTFGGRPVVDLTKLTELLINSAVKNTD